jgi:hypothetical protein
MCTLLYAKEKKSSKGMGEHATSHAEEHKHSISALTEKRENTYQRKH